MTIRGYEILSTPQGPVHASLALHEALRPLEYDLVNQFSRSQLKARQPGCASVEDTYFWKNYSSIYVKMLFSHAVSKSKPGNTYPH